MADVEKLTDAEVRAIAADVLAREMRDLAFEKAEVRSDLDEDDASSLSVTAELGPGVPVLDGDVFSRIHGALHEALLARGEKRFPFFRLHRADDEMPESELFQGWP